MFAGPGSGKSSTCASIFSKLKWKGVDCEMALEYAKDLVWDDHQAKFSNQIAIFGEQHHRVHRLLGKVEVVITDSPLLLSITYGNNEELNRLALSEFNKFNAYNIFIKRVKAYNPNGRNHSLDQAILLDDQILRLLDSMGVPYDSFEGKEDNVEIIVNNILQRIDKNGK